MEREVGVLAEVEVDDKVAAILAAPERSLSETVYTYLAGAKLKGGDDNATPYLHRLTPPAAFVPCGAPCRRRCPHGYPIAG